MYVFFCKERRKSITCSAYYLSHIMELFSKVSVQEDLLIRLIFVQFSPVQETVILIIIQVQTLDSTTLNQITGASCDPQSCSSHQCRAPHLPDSPWSPPVAGFQDIHYSCPSGQGQTCLLAGLADITVQGHLNPQSVSSSWYSVCSHSSHQQLTFSPCSTHTHWIESEITQRAI